MNQGLDIHRFSGLHRLSGMARSFAGSVSDYDENILDSYTVTNDTGWSATRAAGLLAAYLAVNPDMNEQDVAAWAYANGLSNWTFSVDQNDPTTISGTIHWLSNYPRGDYNTFMSYFRQWQAGNDIADLPQPVSILPTTPISPPQSIPSQSAPATSPTSAPATAPAMQPASYQPPASQKQTQGQIPWVWIIAGIAVLYFLMKKKKR